MFPAVVGRERGILRDFADIELDGFITAAGVGETLSRAFEGIEVHPVRVWDPKSAEAGLADLDLASRWPPLTEFARRAYRGPKPVELRPKLKIEIATTDSQFEAVNPCEVCGRFYARLLNVERWPREEKVGEEWRMMPYMARVSGEGLLVRRREIGSSDVFVTDSGLLIVRERVKLFVESMRWRNVKFVEVGEIVT